MGPLKNGETIDGYTRIGDSIYGGYGVSIYLHTTMPALKGVDVSSFMYLYSQSKKGLQAAYICE